MNRPRMRLTVRVMLEILKAVVRGLIDVVRAIGEFDRALRGEWREPKLPKPMSPYHFRTEDRYQRGGER